MAHLSVAGGRGCGQSTQRASARRGVVADPAGVAGVERNFLFPSAGTAAISGVIPATGTKLGGVLVLKRSVERGESRGVLKT